jgi:hypothetical protein
MICDTCCCRRLLYVSLAVCVAHTVYLFLPWHIVHADLTPRLLYELISPLHTQLLSTVSVGCTQLANDV